MTGEGEVVVDLFVKMSTTLRPAARISLTGDIMIVLLVIREEAIVVILMRGVEDARTEATLKILKGHQQPSRDTGDRHQETGKMSLKRVS